MADALARKIADAVIGRVATISGFGETGLLPKLPKNIASFPAAFVVGDEENKEPRTIGSTGGSKTCQLDLILVFYTKDLEAYKALHNVSKAIEDVVEAVPYNLAITEVVRPFVTNVKRFVSTDPLANETGAGEITIRVLYNQPYGAA